MPLKTFLQRDAKKYHSADLAKTYGLFTPVGGDEKIIGYITLICAEVSTEFAIHPEGDGVDFRYPGYPAVKIARLAVHASYRDKDLGLGRYLVEFSLGLAKSVICPNVGCRFMVVDAKKQSVGFYKRVGFTMLDTEANKARPEPVLFVDLNKIEV